MINKNISFIKKGLSLINPRLIKEQIEIFFPSASMGRKLITYGDYYLCLILYGATVHDYFKYEFFSKGREKRKAYITTLGAIRMQKAFNNRKVPVLRNKVLFNTRFKDIRNLNFFTFDGTQKAFGEFVIKCNHNVIMKPINGVCGEGIFKPNVSTEKEVYDLYRRYKDNKNYYCEEAFIQTGVLHEIHPFSVNTVRIYTIRTEDKVEIFFAGIRFGGSRVIVDNIHSGGFCCEIDINTGLIKSKGYDLRGKTYERHPLSGKEIVGVKVPNWDVVTEMIIKCAKMVDEARYIGWDIAVSNEKVSLIEGNEDGNVDVIQLSRQTGIKEEIKKYY